MQIEVAGILKSTKHPKLAAEFMQFTLSDDFQDLIPTTNWAYTVVKTKAGLPKGFETLHLPKKPILLNGESVEKNRKAYIEEWQDAITK